MPGTLKIGGRGNREGARTKIDYRVGGRLHNAAKASAVLQVNNAALRQQTATVGQPHIEIGGIGARKLSQQPCVQ